MTMPFNITFDEVTATLPRLREHVNATPDGCIVWTARKSPKGYGVTEYEGKPHRVHRLIAELHLGITLPKDVLVCHTCDNRPCCNPKHLWLGSVADNNLDMQRKGRNRVPRTFGYRPHVIGESNGRAKLCPKDIAAIRSDIRSSYAIAKQYGVHPTTIQGIKKRKLWGHVEAALAEREKR